jgi:nudix-type nucleoside diphosphatase (YffH/AdpP family)
MRLRDLFLPPPFDAPDTLAPILGDAALPPTRPATLAGHGLRRDPDSVPVALAAAAGERVDGLLLAVDTAAGARLDFAMAALGAAPVPVAPEVAGRTAPAETYVFTAAAPEGQGAPTGEERARLAEALIEIMGHHGRRPPAEMPALVHGIAIRALGRARGPATRAPVVLGTPCAPGDVEPLERDFAYAKYFGVEEHRLRHRRFDGTMSEVLARGVFTSGDAVTVLPFDPRNGTVLMIEQFRTGPFSRRDPRPWSLEPPAGRVDRAEPPEETARREAREEAGVEIGRIERIATFYPSPGIMSEYITAFVGEADLGGAGGVFGLPEEHEDIRALVVPLADALAACASGEINTAPLLLSLFWLDRNAERLRRAWL